MRPHQSVQVDNQVSLGRGVDPEVAEVRVAAITGACRWQEGRDVLRHDDQRLHARNLREATMRPTRIGISHSESTLCERTICATGSGRFAALSTDLVSYENFSSQALAV